MLATVNADASPCDFRRFIGHCSAAVACCYQVMSSEQFLRKVELK